MTDRDQLASIIHDHLASLEGFRYWTDWGEASVSDYISPTTFADAIIAAGWRPPTKARREWDAKYPKQH